MQSLDTNIVLRLLLEDLADEVQKIEQLISTQGPNSLVIEDVVFFEVVWVLSRTPYQLTRKAIALTLLKVTAIPQLKCNRVLFNRVLPIYVAEPRLSFVDICLASYAELGEATPLLTLDRALAKKLPSAQLLA